MATRSTTSSNRRLAWILGVGLVAIGLLVLLLSWMVLLEGGDPIVQQVPPERPILHPLPPPSAPAQKLVPAQASNLRANSRVLDEPILAGREPSVQDLWHSLSIQQATSFQLSANHSFAWCTVLETLDHPMDNLAPMVQLLKSGHCQPGTTFTLAMTETGWRQLVSLTVGTELSQYIIPDERKPSRRPHRALRICSTLDPKQMKRSVALAQMIVEEDPDSDGPERPTVLESHLPLDEVRPLARSRNSKITRWTFFISPIESASELKNQHVAGDEVLRSLLDGVRSKVGNWPMIG